MTLWPTLRRLATRESRYAPASGRRLVLWASELSPFALKTRAMLQHADLGHAWLPAPGARLESMRAAVRIELGKRLRSIERFGGLDPLDEYPLVPFLLEEAGPIRYDSSALARWIDHAHPSVRGPLFPTSPLEAFVAQFIDEAFDELGLYVVHHRRWTTSATDNDAGERLASELSSVLPSLVTRRVASDFPIRQVRRMPYLFSVAPPGFEIRGVPRELTPPARPGFPPTHALLDEIWARLLDSLEAQLGVQPYLLGERFTVADASVYGQLGMNLTDPAASMAMQVRAPRVFSWLCTIRDGEHRHHDGEVRYDAAACGPLLEVLRETFVPLMQQNYAAYARVSAAGGKLFNERAFDRGVACYDGVLCGRPFRSVAKSFQVRPWRELLAAHQNLSGAERREVPLVV